MTTLERAAAAGGPPDAPQHPPLLGHGPRPRAERRAQGREVRSAVPRSAHAGWVAPEDRLDPLEILNRQDLFRRRDLVPIRYGRMSLSPWAFLRGAAAVMAADLATLPRTNLHVQLCGDAHLANFGLFASPDRRTLFDINDFDETHRGPFEWDVKRLAASVAVSARWSGQRPADQERAAAVAVRYYRETIHKLASVDTLDAWYYRVEFEHVLPELRAASARRAARVALHSALRRTSLQAFDRLTAEVDGRRRIVADPPLVVPLPRDTAEEDLERLAELLTAYRSTIDATSARLLSRYRVVDVAQKVVGVGSVGTRAFIVLLQGGDGEPLFLQVKEANASVLAPHLPEEPEPEHHGRRVVEGQRLIQGVTDLLLGWSSVQGVVRRVDFYVRQLRDRKGSVDATTLDPEGLRSYAGLCGVALARAHARSGDAAAIAGYLGTGTGFDRAVASFALAYAQQNQDDYERLLHAVDAGHLEVRRDL